jgi:hypothetical protein
MGWTSRESAATAGQDGIWSYDSQAPAAGTFASDYAPPFTPLFVNAIGSLLLALKPSGSTVPAFVQGAASNSTSTQTSWSATFPSPVTAGNCLVIDIWFNGATSETVSDSLGNVYTPVAGQESGAFTLSHISQYVCSNCNGGACTVTYTPNASVGQASIAIHEYSGVASSSSIDAFAVTTSNVFAWGPCNLSIATTGANRLLHTFNGQHFFFPPVVPPSGGNPLSPPFLTPSWLLVNEPGIGLTDRSKYLHLGAGAQHSFNLQQRQRGVASYTLVSDPQDATSAPASYLPTLFQPIYLFDQNATGWTGPVFAGLIQDFTERWVGTDGLRFIDVSAVSLEAVFDTIYVDGTDLFIDQNCGFIVAALFNKYCAGCPVALGSPGAGAVIPAFQPAKGTKISECFSQLATTSLFIWGVNPQTQTLYFYTPATTPAPFSLTSTQALWDSISRKNDGADYRNRQGVKGSYDAFPHSMEFIAGAGQQSITLMRPVQQVVTAYITLATCNTATGTMPSGNFAPGDTVTIGPAAGARQASHVYGLGGQIIYQGYVQQITTAGTTGGGAIGSPTGPSYVGPSGTVFGFNPVPTGVTTDGTAIWTNEGATGLGAGDAATSTYTAVTALDNTQYGQFLIAGSGAASIQNLADCINATVTRAGTQLRGVTFSLPTWENSQCNALYTSGTSFTLQQKAAGTGWVSDISTTSASFSWSSPNTTGGTSPQGSVGPNEPGTITIQVYQQGTSTAAPGVAYTQGSAVISLATPLNAGTNLNVEYTRTDGNVIEVENTSLVTALALVSHGTGKIQQFTDQSSTGLIQTSALALLQFAQEALASYDVAPTELEVILYQPGILPSQVWTWALAFNSALNGAYFVVEVKAELVPTYPWLDNPNAINAGHYRYTIKVVNISQIADYLDFWEGLGGGGSSGGGAGGSLVATSGGATPTQVSGNQIALETNGTLNSSQLLLDLVAGAGVTLTDGGGGAITIAAPGGSVTSASIYTTSWSAQMSVTVTHNLGTRQVLVQVFDASGNVVIPQSATITSGNVVTLTFGAAFTGSVVALGFVSTPSSAQEYSTSWTAQTSVTVTHNLNSSDPLVQVFDGSGNLVEPQSLVVTSANVVTLGFGAAFTGSVTVVAIVDRTGADSYVQSWSAQTSVTLTHNLGTTSVITQVYDASGNQVVPQSIQVTSANVVTLTFGAAFTGSAVVVGIAAAIGVGTVTSVALTVPAFLLVAGSPVTGAGTLAATLATEPVNTIFAGPSSGPSATPTFRALVNADMPGSGAGAGTVTSVAASVPVEFVIAGSPITGAGTLAITKATQSANTVFAGPSSGAAAQPAFRALTPADLIQASANITGQTTAQTVVTFTPAALGMFRVGGYVTITAISLDVLQLQLLWTDETNTARTLVMLPIGGGTLTTTGAFSFPAVDIRVKASTAITLQVALTTGSGSVTYDAGGSIQQTSA